MRVAKGRFLHLVQPILQHSGGCHGPCHVAGLVHAPPLELIECQPAAAVQVFAHHGHRSGGIALPQRGHKAAVLPADFLQVVHRARTPATAEDVRRRLGLDGDGSM